ncbi:MAG: aryl-sulfate sulfotransferase [Pseudomonadota bacterium]
MRALALLPLVLPACGPTADLELSLTQSAAIPTVFTATVDGAASGLDAAWVEFGRDGAWDHRAPLDISGDPPWQVTLLGMKPLSDYEVRLGVQLDGEGFTGRAHTAGTGGVPAEFPDFSLERGGGESFGGYYLTSVLGLSTAAVILDSDGEYVWWYQPEGITEVGRTVPTRDGSGLLVQKLNPNAAEAGEVVRVSTDGTQAQATDLPWGHHDLYEHADGTLAYIASVPLDVEGTEVSGAAIVERAPDGSTSVVWDIWDHEDAFPYEPGAGGPAGAWPHANALDYLPGEGAYLVSFLYLDAIAKVDRASGDLLWVMGGDTSDFTLEGGSTDLFERTHQLERLDDSLLVFVNGAQQGGESYAVEYALDESDPVVEPLWAYHPEPSLSCLSLGDVHRFDSGNTLVTFSYSGQLHEVDPDGEVVWKLSAGAGGVFSYVTPVEDLVEVFGG